MIDRADDRVGAARDVVVDAESLAPRGLDLYGLDGRRDDLIAAPIRAPGHRLGHELDLGVIVKTSGGSHWCWRSGLRVPHFSFNVPHNPIRRATFAFMCTTPLKSFVLEVRWISANEIIVRGVQLDPCCPSAHSAFAKREDEGQVRMGKQSSALVLLLLGLVASAVTAMYSSSGPVKLLDPKSFREQVQVRLDLVTWWRLIIQC